MENYIVSARKYRPQTFESVVGQQTLTQTLQNAIRQDRLAHAYLFCGPRGVGKTTCARIFAKTINSQYLKDRMQPLPESIYRLSYIDRNKKRTYYTDSSKQE